MSFGFGGYPAAGSSFGSPSSLSGLSEQAKAVYKAQLIDPPDFKISIEDYTWSVHTRHISSSGFFKKLSNGPFIETKNKSVTLHDDAPTDVARLILWFYYGNYPVSEVDSLPSMPSIKEMIKSGATQSGSISKDEYLRQGGFIPPKEQYPRHFDMYLLADKYDIPSLRKHCVHQLRQAISFDPEFVWILVDFTESATEKDIKTDDIKAVVEETLARDPRTYIRHPRFEAKIKDSPDFAWTLVRRLVGSGF